VERHEFIRVLYWGILWRSVLWYTVAGVAFGGLDGCASGRSEDDS
jgi:hypothetical protein